jgi:hypothetical protein
MFDYPTNTTSDPKTGSTDPLVTSGKEKTYNIAAFLSGIFVIFILVFPVIVIIAICKYIRYIRIGKQYIFQVFLVIFKSNIYM